MLAPTRWKLRRAVAAVNGRLAALGLDPAREKTFVGRVERGFDFLGYRFADGGLGIAPATATRFIERATRLCEHEPRDTDGAARLGAYVRRWRGWASGGLDGAARARLPALAGVSVTDLLHRRT